MFHLRLKTSERGLPSKPRMWLVATRDVKKGKEVIMMYGDDYTGYATTTSMQSDQTIYAEPWQSQTQPQQASVLWTP